MAHQTGTLALTLGLLLFPGLSPATHSHNHPAHAAVKELKPFIGDLEAAQKEARERNAPLLIHIILEGEEQNDEYRGNLLPNRELIELSEGCVVIVGNNGEHRTIQVTGKDGEKRQVCSAYQMFENCGQHRATWDPIYHAYQDDNGELGCPQTVLHGPDGEIAWRHNIRNPPSASEIAKAIKSAKKKYGPSLTADELRTVKGHHIAATNAAKALDWPTVWERCQAILEISELGVWAEGAKASQAEAIKEMKAQLESLEERFVPGQAAEAWRELTTFEAATRKTPIAREISSLKKKVERDKDIKEELALIKAEMAAEALEAEAESLLRQGEDKKAMRIFKKVLGKRYAETEAAKRVRARFPDLD